MIAQIEDSEEGEPLFDAKVTVLGEYIEHHVEEEEKELFPKVSKTDLDLEALGKQLKARKTGLLATMEDQDEEDVEASPPPKSKSTARPTTGRR